MKKKVVIGSCILLCAIGVMILVIRMYFSYLAERYDQVQKELPLVKQKLIKLNIEKLALISNPEGTEEIERIDLGSEYDSYGIRTYVQYTQDSPDFDIQTYYQGLMKRLGWILASSYYGEDIVETKYNYEDACVVITTFPKYNPTIVQTYSILVYHDFIKQGFSPELPPKWYMSIREYGKTDIIRCP